MRTFTLSVERTSISVESLMPIARLMREHASLTASGFVLFIFALKMMAVSNGNLTTAIILLRETSPFEALIATLVIALPTLAAVTVALCVALNLYRPDRDSGGAERRFKYPTGAMLLLALLSVVAFVVPWGRLAFALAGASVFLGVVFVSFRWRYERFAAGHQLHRLFATITTLVFVGSLVAASATDAHMWLPPERFVVDDATTVIGYALSEDDNRLVVLLHKNREVIVLNSESVASRTYCTVPADLEFSNRLRMGEPVGAILGAIGGAPDYPDCDARHPLTTSLAPHLEMAHALRDVAVDHPLPRSRNLVDAPHPGDGLVVLLLRSRQVGVVGRRQGGFHLAAQRGQLLALGR